MNELTTASPTSTLPPCEQHDDTQTSANAHTSKLRGHVQSVATVDAEQAVEMYALLCRYFDNVTPEQFAADLGEKEAVIVLRDAVTGALAGFSTLMRLRVVVAEEPVIAFFSGDTIIERAYWGTTVLPQLWAQHVFKLAATICDAAVYWFLISSGYKTYRFLPTFFHEFYPNYWHATPAQLQRILDALAQQKFCTGYDPKTGIVRMAQSAPLRPGVAPLTTKRLRDPHIAFFNASNPRHAEGDELACITRLDPTNLTAAGRRMLYGTT